MKTGRGRDGFLDTDRQNDEQAAGGLDERSRYLRRLIIRGLEGGNRGHIGSSMSLVEILRVLYDDILRFDPAQPRWEDRDRFILSKGHGCLALYAVLADKGFFPLKELDQFCDFESILGGHPERGKVPGVEASTGALGHGLSIGVGLALAGRIKNKEHRVFVVMGDGEINEGSVWEAAMCAAKHRLDNLIAMIDYNKLHYYGPVEEVQGLEPLADKWKSFGFAVREVDGHDVDALRRILSKVPFNPHTPGALICHTVKGKGISFAEHNPEWHHKSRMKPELFEAMYRELER